MLELYPEIRQSHIWAISLSCLIMALRYLGSLAGMRWPHHIVPRILAWTVDGAVLTVAAMLLTILPKEIYANGWLTVKLILVAVYFALGYYGLAPRHNRGKRALFAAITMGSFALAYGIARAHDPLGWFA